MTWDPAQVEFLIHAEAVDHAQWGDGVMVAGAAGGMEVTMDGGPVFVARCNSVSDAARFVRTVERAHAMAGHLDAARRTIARLRAEIAALRGPTVADEGCACTTERGDSDCLRHPTCNNCGASIDETRLARAYRGQKTILNHQTQQGNDASDELLRVTALIREWVSANDTPARSSDRAEMSVWVARANDAERELRAAVGAPWAGGEQLPTVVQRAMELEDRARKMATVVNLVRDNAEWLHELADSAERVGFGVTAIAAAPDVGSATPQEVVLLREVVASAESLLLQSGDPRLEKAIDAYWEAHYLAKRAGAPTGITEGRGGPTRGGR